MPRRALPTGTVTLLFTDIEGSTRLLREHGDDYTQLLLRHHAIIRRAIAAGDGVEVGTAGDSFFVAFPRPGHAVRAALDIQRALDQEPWPRDTRVRVRIGMHTGRPVLVGEDYAGIDVHRAARISAVAHGGQVLCSAETVAAWTEEREWGLGVDIDAVTVDLGEHHLKDLADAENLIQVSARGAPAAFPPLRTGQHAPAAAQLPDYDTPPADVPCPYKGLTAFTPEDEAEFRGRDGLVRAAVARLDERPFLAVVGASGVGKSSFLLAGVVPRWTREHGGTSVVLAPGSRPLAALDDAMATRTGGAPTIVVVDQLEELFTLGADDAERQQFVDRLFGGLRPGDVVAMSLRADFYGHLVTVPRLAAAVQDDQLLLGPMGEDELREAIEGPAAHVGLTLEPGLVQTVLRDVAGQPGALPLLSHALYETWARRSGRLLSVVGYERSGGVRGAVAATAERVHLDLDDAERAIERRIFLRLTALGEGTEDTRRSVDARELRFSGVDPAAIDRVLATLSQARLVTIGERTVEIAHEAVIGAWPRLHGWLTDDRDALRAVRRISEATAVWEELGRDPGALMRGASLLTAQEIAERMGDELSERELEFVRSSSASERNELVAARRQTRRLAVLTGAVALMLVASLVATVVAVRQTDEARSQAALTTSRALAAAALDQLGPKGRVDRALLVAALAYRTSPTPEARSALLHTIQTTAPMAEVRAASSLLMSVAAAPDAGLVVAGDLDGGIQLFRARTPEPDVAETAAGPVEAVDVSRDGRVVVAGTRNGELVGLDPTTRMITWRRQAHDGPVATVRIDDAARTVRSVSAYDGSVRTWILDDGTSVGPQTPVPVAVDGIVAFDESARVVALVRDDGTVALHDASTGAPVSGWRPAGQVASLALRTRSGSSPTLVAGLRDGTVAILEPGAEPVAQRWFSEPATSVDISADGRVVAGSEQGAVRFGDLDGAAPETQAWASLRAATAGAGVLFDDRGDVYTWVERSMLRWAPRGSALVRTMPVEGARQVAVRPDGGQAAITRADGTLVVTNGPASLDNEPALSMTLEGVGPGAYRTNGDLVVVHGTRLEVRSSIDPTRVLATTAGLSPQGYDDITLAPDDRTVALRSRGTLTLVSLDRTETPQVFGDVHTADITDMSFSPDGRLLATSSDDGIVRLWDVPGRRVLPEPVQGPGAFRTNAAVFRRRGDLVVGGNAGSLQVFDVEQFRRTATMDAAQQLLVLGVATDDRTIAVASQVGTLRLGDLEAATMVGAGLPIGTAPVDLKFSPTGGALLTIDALGLTVWDSLLWSRDDAALTNRVCALVGRDLSTEERVTFAQGAADGPLCGPP